MKSSRHFLWLLLLIPLIWWAWPSANDNTTEPQTQEAPRSSALAGSTATGALADGSTPARPKRLRPQKDPRRTLPAPSFPEIDRILSDDAISIEEAVRQLLALARNSNLPTAQRLEALEHGLNLDTAAFQPLATDPRLPAEMAHMLLHAFINFNEFPAAQIQVYMALMNHSDKEVSTEARSELAFQVGDDNEELNPAQLIERARQKLQE
jgi:hypothetical protein